MLSLATISTRLEILRATQGGRFFYLNPGGATGLK